MARTEHGDAQQDGGAPRRRGTPGVLGAAAGPVTRTGRYYAESWRDYLSGDPHELPLARPSLALAAHAFRDEVTLLGLKARRPISDPQEFTRIESEVVAALENYRARGWLAQPWRFFAAPPPLLNVTVKPASSFGRHYERLSFDSGYAPESDEPGAQRWHRYTANTREYALMLRHNHDRPWLICVHGAEMGRAALDLTLFRAWHLHNDLGLNVVLPVLPMHGPRGRGLPKGVVFPNEDIMNTVHASAQAVWDVRRLISWIRLQQPDSAIGLYGISLGGYVSSLVASLDSDLRCAILGVPVVDLIELLGRHSGLAHGDSRRRTVELAEPLGRMTSPLALTPRVPPRGRFIYAGIADQLVHPRGQVIRLWKHWGRPEIVWYRGGHTGFFESRPVQKFLDAALDQSGLLDEPEARPGDQFA